MPAQTLFGTPAQRRLLRRGREMFALIRDNPDYTYYGRLVGIRAPDRIANEQLFALVRLQGSSSCSCLTPAAAKALGAAAEAAGFDTHFYAQWNSLPACLDLAREKLAAFALPDDLQVQVLSGDSPADLRDSLADVTSAAGVLLPNLDVLTGGAKSGVCVVATTAEGTVVSCAAAASYPATEPETGLTPAWWGMLATSQACKGRGLAGYLGAKALMLMHERFGYTRFFTGITPGNRPSEAVCTRSGFADGGNLIMALSDPDVLRGGRVTK